MLQPEGLIERWLLYAARFDTFCAGFDAFCFPVNVRTDFLNVRFKGSFRFSGHILSNTAL